MNKVPMKQKLPIDMRISYWPEEGKKTPRSIIISFPHEKFANYLNHFKTKTFEDLNVSQMEQIFLMVIDDFKKGIMSIDDISVISFNMFNHGVHIEKEFSLTDFAGVLLSFGEELSFYLRKAADDTRSAIQFSSFLRRVLDFSNKRKAMSEL